ncbi:MAG: uncharacterized protein KVP18_003766 [Porospora cf. gigantea A]|uniref:uncharacterized protein n=1 Tax=Porospora cf. gigantea A TaxID=2853593 RepID=UPI0035599B6C|nr:MAG: hypothetical protein KVP18_003766 [Porospora cf. gigantea A]
MSQYGWLTESSLLPRPAKPIDRVSSTGLTGIRSALEEAGDEVKTPQKTRVTRKVGGFRTGGQKSSRLTRLIEKCEDTRRKPSVRLEDPVNASRRALERKALVYVNVGQEALSGMDDRDVKETVKHFESSADDVSAKKSGVRQTFEQPLLDKSLLFSPEHETSEAHRRDQLRDRLSRLRHLS